MTVDRDFGTSWYCAALRRDLVHGRPDARPLCGQSLLLRTRRDGSVTAELAGRPAPVRVRGEEVFVWYQPAGQAPSYELPAWDSAGFTRKTHDTLEVRTSPAHIMRDLADYEHFERIHGYRDVSIDEPFFVDGKRCGLGFSFDRPVFFASRLVTTTRAVVRSECLGLGYQLTTVYALRGALCGRFLVMPTPTVGAMTRVTLGVDVSIRRPFSGLPKIALLAHAFARRAFARDVALDTAGWKAVASASDEEATRQPLAAYWSWAKQFVAIERASAV